MRGPRRLLADCSQFNHVAAYRPQLAQIRDLVRQTKPGQVNVLQIR